MAIFIYPFFKIERAFNHGFCNRLSGGKLIKKY